jgi:hypothetical protein
LRGAVAAFFLSVNHKLFFVILCAHGREAQRRDIGGCSEALNDPGLKHIGTEQLGINETSAAALVDQQRVRAKLLGQEDGRRLAGVQAEIASRRSSTISIQVAVSRAATTS